MRKRYYYQLVSRYLAVSVRSRDRAVFIDPHPALLREFSSYQCAFVFRTRETADIPLPEGWTLLPDWEAVRAARPDYIVLAGNFHYMPDVQVFLEKVRGVCKPEARVIAIQYSAVWKPLLMLASRFGAARSNRPRGGLRTGSSDSRSF